MAKTPHQIQVARQQKLLASFVNRQLKNLDLIKDLSIDELDQYIKSLRPRPIFFTGSYKRQKAAFITGITESTALFLMFLGSGKTKVSLDIIAYRILLGQIQKVLVLCPDEANTANWKNECVKHRPDLKAQLVLGNREKKLAGLAKEAHIYITTYSGLQTILADQTFKNINPSLARKRIVQVRDVLDFSKLFQGVILDESITVANAKSLTSSICYNLSLSIKYRYLLTGYPFSKDPAALWHQLLIADHGETLGSKEWVFKSAFFDMKKNPFGIEWKINEEAKPKLHRILQNRCLNYSEDTDSTLPPLNKIPTTLHLKDEALDIYKQVAKDLVADRSKQWVARLENHFIKLRQVCSGYCKYKNDLNQEQKISFKSEKDILLEQICKDLPVDSKILIYYVYTDTGEHIVDLLTKWKIKCSWLWGGAVDKPKIYNDFKNDISVTALVVNVKSGSRGLNLQESNYIINYELPVEPELYTQIQKRIHRDGQTKPCYIYDFITENTVEEKIYTNLQVGINLFQEIIQGKIAIEDSIGSCGKVF